jgi:hypothetical protein
MDLGPLVKWDIMSCAKQHLMYEQYELIQTVKFT